MVSLATLAGCGALPGPRGRCDQAALQSAADAAEAMLASWQPQAGALPDYQVAVRGLQAACPALPEGFHGFLAYTVYPVADTRSSAMDLGTPLWKDAEGMRSLRAHCPDHQRILDEVAVAPADRRTQILYDGCKFDALGLVAREELPDSLGDTGGVYSHALYLWLVDDGAEPDVARALVRPILFGTDYALESSYTLPPLPAVARGEPTSWFVSNLYVHQGDATFDNKKLVHFEQGRLADHDHTGAKVSALHDALSEELDKQHALAANTGKPPEPLRLALAADPALRWETVGRLAWTAMHAGYDALEIRAVAADPLHPLVALPLVTRGAEPTGELTIGASEVVVRCGTEARTTDAAALARELASCGARPLRLAVVEEVRWQRVAEVLAELAGKATITALAQPGAARLDSEDPVYVAVEPGVVVRLAGGTTSEMRAPDDGPVWHLGFSPQGVAYALGFDRVYRIGDDGLVPVTRDKAPTNGGSLVGFAPVSDAEIWAFDEVTVVRWNGTRWDDLSPGPVADLAKDYDVRRQMNALHVDRDGRVWASALRSLHLREGDAWRGLNPALDLAGAQINDIVEDAAGVVHLHLSTDKFLRIVPGATPAERDRISTATPPPGTTWQDDDSVTIVGADGKRRSYMGGRDFPGRTHGFFAGDTSGRLWTLTGAGLAVLGPAGQRTIWPIGTLPALAGKPHDIVVRGAGPRTLPPVGPPQTGGLRGVVYLGGLPLPRAAVELCPHPLMIQPRPCEGSEPTLATRTTADGSWELTTIPIGPYGISVQTPEGWKIAFQASMALDKRRMTAGEIIDLGSLDVTGGMVAQTMPWRTRPKRGKK